MRSRDFSLWMVPLVLVATAGASFAAVSPQAREHFEKARAFLTLGNYRAAAAEFEEAYRWSSKPSMLYDAVVAYQRLGEGAEAGELKHAVELCRRYLAALTGEKERPRIEVWIAEAEGRIAIAETEAKQREEARARHAEANKQLRRLDVAHVETPPRPKWIAGADAGLAIGIAVGAVAIGIGGKLIYDDGRQTCTPVPPAVQCPRLAHMESAGIGMVVGGGALALGAAAALLYIELKLGRPAPAIKPLTLSPIIGSDFAGIALGGAL